MRKRFALLAVVAAALAVPSIAAAAIPRGSLVGLGSIGGTTPFDFNATVLDGEQMRPTSARKTTARATATATAAAS